MGNGRRLAAALTTDVAAWDIFFLEIEVPWLVALAEHCSEWADVTPLPSFDIVIGLKWMEEHYVKIQFSPTVNALTCHNPTKELNEPIPLQSPFDPKLRSPPRMHDGVYILTLEFYNHPTARSNDLSIETRKTP